MKIQEFTCNPQINSLQFVTTPLINGAWIDYENLGISSLFVFKEKHWQSCPLNVFMKPTYLKLPLSHEQRRWFIFVSPVKVDEYIFARQRNGYPVVVEPNSRSMCKFGCGVDIIITGRHMSCICVSRIGGVGPRQWTQGTHANMGWFSRQICFVMCD